MEQISKKPSSLLQQVCALIDCYFSLMIWFRYVSRHVIQEAGKTVVPTNASSVRRITKKKNNDPRVLLMTDINDDCIFQALGDVELVKKFFF
jgi:hypothetical protein